jgi:hypothetical protein
MGKTKRPGIALEKPLITCEILRTVAESYPARSRQRRAVREATEALVFVTTHRQLKASFEEFRRSSAKPLTETQEQTLKKLGIIRP